MGTRSHLKSKARGFARALVTLGVLAVLAAPHPALPASGARLDEPAGGGSGPAAGVRRALVVLPSNHVIEVEIADTPARIQKGYMFRERISDNEGMVFFHAAPGFYSYWMKNCRVPLDIAWLDVQWNVVHLEENLPPCTEDPCPAWMPLRAARYVLEVRAGLAAREGVKVGTHVVFVPTDPPEPPDAPAKNSRH